MSRPNDEPLSLEERAMADRLARLGPHDGPPSALDAKILAAAHAAVAPPRRRRRWLGLTAIPGGLITGAGMAAALAVVVGVVWQLRPSGPTPQLPREEGDMGHISAEMIKRAPPAPPPPPPPAQAPEPARALQPPRETRPALARRQEAPVAAAAPTSDAHEHYLDEAIAPASTPAPAAAPPAPAVAPAPYASAAADAAAATQVEQARDQAGARQFSDDGAARQRGESAMAAKARAASVEPSSPALERIETTGSRMKSGAALAAPTSLADVPVDEDAALDAKAWIERIRERRDAGDLDGARASLRRFVEVHPRVRLPRDVRELAARATR